jgi:hypothetical protein
VAAAADRRSGHPLAKAVVDRAQQLNLDLAEPTDFVEVRGRGVKANIAGQSVYVGNALLLEENGITVPTDEAEGCGTRSYVAVDQILVGSLDLGDRLRPGAKEAIDRLKASGIKRVVMLTGDHLRTAQQVAAAQAYLELSPPTVTGASSIRKPIMRPLRLDASPAWRAKACVRVPKLGQTVRRRNARLQAMRMVFTRGFYTPASPRHTPRA